MQNSPVLFLLESALQRQGTLSRRLRKRPGVPSGIFAVSQVQEIRAVDWLWHRRVPLSGKLA